MPKLNGLLDTARSKIGGLLGDFPEAFNAGTAAGFPGWAGDMAYAADTARLALSGERTQPLPVDVPGTSDWFAKQAGYTAPSSLSGQLGWLAGQMLSPSPGDLAVVGSKLGPALAAIPAWHGSPHKFDAFDLSHMGKGEGAQAYGWGAYLASLKNVAESYRDALSGAKLDDTESMANAVFDILAKDSPHGDKVAAGVNRSLYGRDDFVRAVLDGRIDTSSLSPRLVQSAEDLLKQDASLYRTSLEWPDPAKEAATPLTGEDLLQWDRPLSEQTPAAQKALREMWGKARKSFTQLDPDADPMAGQVLHLYQQHRGGNAEAVSKELAEAGIPGTRYLDGMSRDGGKGTYNYVMFDDKGIKLLERNGSPIEDFAARRAGKAKPYREAVGVDGPMRLPDNALMGTAEFKVKPPKRLFRGVGEGGSTTGTYALGKGLYTSRDKSFAAMYGEVSEVSPDDAWPRNPLVLNQVAGGAPGAFADWALKTSGLKNMREFNKLYADPGEFVRSLGYDGVIAGDEVVRYPIGH